MTRCQTIVMHLVDKLGHYTLSHIFIDQKIGRLIQHGADVCSVMPIILFTVIYVGL